MMTRAAATGTSQAARQRMSDSCQKDDGRGTTGAWIRPSRRRWASMEFQTLGLGSSLARKTTAWDEIRLRSDSSSLARSEEHTSELQSHSDLVCRLLLEKKKKKK